MLKFDKETHIYSFNGRHIPGVNEILRAEGVLPDFGPNAEHARLLGTYTHQAIALLLKDNLREDSLSPEIAARIAQFKRFQQEVGLTPKIIETPLISEKWGFAGTPDCLTEDGTLYDWKITPSFQDYYHLTLSAYAMLCEEATGVRPKKMYTVHILPNTYRIKECHDERQTFLAFLLAYKWKKERRII